MMPPILEQRHNSILDGLDLTPMDASSDAHKKLAVLGLPWETTEDTLRLYFEQFGTLENAEVMKDRYTGKSRGFGFVTFADLSSAQSALAAEHTIEGRRCEAKVALPKGEPSPPRTTRIFVARIPPSVSEAQFKGYFEGFGKLQDAYMPRDHAKQGYRGIGFVTYTSADSVEKVMAVKHWMNGHEIAIDRATPKEEPSILKSLFARLPLSTGQRRSFDNGAGIIGPGLTSIMTSAAGLSNLRPRHAGPLGGMEHHAYQQLRSLSEDRQGPGMEGAGLDLSKAQHAFQNGLSAQALRSSQAPLGLGMSLGMHAPMQPPQASPHHPGATAAAAATTAALHNLAKAQQQHHHHHHQQQQQSQPPPGVPTHSSSDAAAAAAAATLSLTSGGGAHAQHHIVTTPTSMPHLPPSNSVGLHGLPHDVSASLLSYAKAGGLTGGVPADMGAAVQQLMAAAAAQSSRRSLDSAAAALKRLENPAIASARAGPRIFVGKLTKETSEADVREYFMRFGYVMDVYMPKAKDNKTEHRGFGFVTFETEAAIQRVVSHGAHRLKGSTIAIDIAVPKVEEETLGEADGGVGVSPHFLNPALSSFLAQRI